MIALQCCVGFCHTSTWISHRYIYALSLLNLPPTPSDPSRLSQNAGLSSLCHTVNSYWGVYIKYVTLYRRQWPNHPKEKERQEGKVIVWGGFTNSQGKNRSKSKVERERYTWLSVEFQRIARRDKKVFLSEQWEELEENNRMGKTTDFFQEN